MQKGLSRVLRHLPDAWAIYSEPQVYGLRPDFVILAPELGLLVMEVKDWWMSSLPAITAHEAEIHSCRMAQANRVATQLVLAEGYWRAVKDACAGSCGLPAVDGSGGQIRDFVPEAPTLPSVIEFMWNDFTVFRDEPAFTHNHDRAFVYGQPAAAYLLQQAGGAGAQVHGVIRAHQHSGAPNPLMRRLAAGNGAFRHWQENASVANQIAEVAALAGRLETAAERPLAEGSVWTLNVTPDSVYGQGCGFDFATAIMLRLAPAFADWRLRVEPVVVPKLAGR